MPFRYQLVSKGWYLIRKRELPNHFQFGCNREKPRTKEGLTTSVNTERSGAITTKKFRNYQIEKTTRKASTKISNTWIHNRMNLSQTEKKREEICSWISNVLTMIKIMLLLKSQSLLTQSVYRIWVRENKSKISLIQLSHFISMGTKTLSKLADKA